MPRVSKNKRRPITNKKKKGKNKKSSGTEYMEKLRPNIPADPNEFLRQTASTIASTQEQMASFIHNNDQDAFKNLMRNMMKPMEVTPAVLRGIRDDIPTSENIIWYVDIHVEHEMDVSLMHCHVHLVDDDYREEDVDPEQENYNIGNKKNRLMQHLGYCFNDYEHEDVTETIKTIENQAFDEKNLVIGTIAKTIHGNGLPPIGSATFMKLPEGENMKPKQIIVASAGLRDKLLPELKAMGYHQKYITLADSEIIQEAAVKRKLHEHVSDGDHTAMNINPDENIQAFRAAMVQDMQSHRAEIPYVSEERKQNAALVHFTATVTEFPKEWFCKAPPRDGSSYRLTRLLGWRTNLELSVTHMDVPRVIQITSSHDPEEIRELCEIRCLLLKMAKQGLAKACSLLLNRCHVSPNGMRDHNFLPQWTRYAKDSGVDHVSGECPLIAAAKQGQYDACKVLLDHLDTIIDIKCFRLGSTPLHYAISSGHLDVVELLCVHGADVSVTNMHGMDSLDLLEAFSHEANLTKTGASLSQFKKIEAVLLKYRNN